MTTKHLLIIFLIILFLIRNKETFTVQYNQYFLDDGNKLCCGQQYPVPFKHNYEDDVCNNNNEYVSSDIVCNSSYNDTGCLCLTKDQFNHLSNRGKNSDF